MKLPEDLVHYRDTSEFDAASIPAGLLRSHTLRRGTWGRIVVTEGQLLYIIEGPVERRFVLDSQHAGIVEPEMPHRIEALGSVRFRVEFHHRTRDSRQT